MAKPKQVTPPPPDSGQDYIEMDRIPPRRGNPKEAQRTIGILVGSIAVLVVGIGLRSTVFKPRFDTPTSQETTPLMAGNKETVTDIPTGFTQGPIPNRVRVPGTKTGTRAEDPVPSPFEKRGAAAEPGTTANTDTTTAETSGKNTYDPFSVVRSATSQSTVPLTPRSNTADAGAAGATSPYTSYALPGTSPARDNYSPSTTTPPVGGSAVSNGAYGTGGGAYGSSGSAYGTGGSAYGSGAGSTTGGGLGSTGGTGSYGAGNYGSSSGTTSGTSGTSTGGIYGSPR